MADKSEEKANIRVPPPFFFLMCLSTGLVLEYFFPLKLFELSWAARITSGSILVIISGYFAIGSIHVLKKNKTPFDPARPTRRIVKDGPFSLSRNPMYLSLVVLTAGIAFYTFSLWLFAAIFFLFLLLHFFAVRPEENYLQNKFGNEYSEYKNVVRRWI